MEPRNQRRVACPCGSQKYPVTHSRYSVNVLAGEAGAAWLIIIPASSPEGWARCCSPGCNRIGPTKQRPGGLELCGWKVLKTNSAIREREEFFFRKWGSGTTATVVIIIINITTAHESLKKGFLDSCLKSYEPGDSSTHSLTIQQWLARVQSLLYCNENGFWGTFLESQRSCVCHGSTTLCQRPIPCIIGGNNSCAMCSLANISLCGSCNKGYKLYRGRCEPQNVDSERSEQFISFETDLDFQDLELKYLLQKMDSRLYVHTTFISNEIRLDTFFDPRWRKRMSLTLKSNKNRMDFIHMVIGMSMRICQMRNSSLDPMFFVYVNPFSGSHSEGWNMPFGEFGYPRWEKIRLQNSQCYNWTLLLGNRWKTFFETVHIYLRSRTRLPTLLRNETGQGPVDLSDPSKRQFYIKISDVQVFGYSLRFNADLLRSAVQQVNQSYTQGGQFYSSSSVMLLLLDIRDRINRLAPPVAPGKPQLDLFSCMLKHRLKLTNSEIIRVNHALDLYNTEILKQSDQMTAKLC
eukprot:bmy_11851T0